jgi:hypothetical protein
VTSTASAPTSTSCGASALTTRLGAIGEKELGAQQATPDDDPQSSDVASLGPSHISPETVRRRWLGVLLAIIVPAGVIATIYIAPFASDPTMMPFGVDTSMYIWRVNVVHDLGIASLTPETTNAPKPLGDRPGYPIVLSLLRSVTGLSSLSLMWLTPALFASALGLAAASLASDGALERRRRSGAVAIAVGGSAFVAWTAVGYAANLALNVVVIGAAVMALMVARGRRGMWAGAILLGGAVLLHWMFSALFIALLGAAGVVQLVRPRTETADPRRLAFKRLVMMLGLGAVLGVGGLLLAPQLPQRLPDVDPGRPGPAHRVELRLPALALPLTLPLATLGTTLLALDRRIGRRHAAVLLGVWSSIALVSVVAWFILDLPLPPYRWAGFALAIPAAIVLGTYAAGDRFVGSGRHAVALVPDSLAVVASVALAAAGASVWWSREPTLVAYEFAQLRTLTSYLEPLPVETRVVILMEAYRKRAPFNRAWTMLPPKRFPHVTMVAARVRPDAPDLGLPPAAQGRPGTVVVALDAFRRPAGIGTPIGPGVHLLSGPGPRGVEPGVPPRAPPPIVMALTVVILLSVLVFAGGGWAATLSDLPVLGFVSMAPAFGVAILGGTGLVASRLGVPLRGGGGIGLVGLIAISGWVAALLVRRGNRGHRPPSTARTDLGRRYGSSSALGPS